MQQPGMSKNSKKLVLTPTMRLQARQARRKAAKTYNHELFRQRLLSLQNSTTQTSDPNQILQQRAQELARPLTLVNAETLVENTVILQQKNCRLALPVAFVREIVPVENITYVPGVPDFIAGVVNVRGKIITLVNLEIFIQTNSSLADSAAEPGQKQSIVMIEIDDFEFGVLCQDFPQVQYLENKTIQPILTLVTDYCPDFLAGLTPGGILCLNLTAIVNNPAFLVIQE